MHLIVFSHLRWDFVFQRPQHLLSRLAATWPVVFVEEPVHIEGEAHLEEREPMQGVRVLKPCTPLRAPGFHDDQLGVLKGLVDGWLESHRIDDYAIWLYTPMALPLTADLAPRAVIYDCMDELSAFRGAPRQMLQREQAVLRRADVVLTGGPSLYEAKRVLHPNALCLPSAVDAAHFERSGALARGALVARADALQGSIPAPRLGYYGVIDERLDLDLVAAVADADATWQVVMVGPVVKIDPASLPQRPNLQWLGQQPYELLPQLVAGWDACLMPFALNESTRFISPTKTLEYMAAGRPVVSTGVHDVISLYGDVVRLGHDPASFVRACRDALAESAPQRRAREAQMAARVARYSWDETAHTIHGAIARVLASGVAADDDNAARAVAGQRGG